ncbi:PKD domain-containing protein [Arthrobacter silvisoli]|uniref:PKD domain-containing protein n=1 Tax=Arthrobacter silvisoli TaxID=2291022 RepID=UPI000E212AC9|nr:PKD domain-containing protein [Arthrobacter silvisoli]
MTPAKRTIRRLIASLGLAALFGGILAAPALADSAPVNPGDPKTPVTVTADSLPTAQHDGVAWQAVTLGNTVYVAGKFSNARPYGAAPGTQLVPRRNILAFDLASGLLKSNFAPNLNGQALSITASPDGSRIYVGGDFTTVNGVQRLRIAALDPSTGSLIPSFAPKVAASVRAIVASNSTVWFGGTFNAVGSVSRNRLAAVNASDGALLPWDPSADDGRVNALALSPTADRVVVGGAFTTLNGLSRPGYGLGMVNSSTGASLAIQANDVVRDAGDQSAILSLSTDGTQFYGTGYIFGTGGNLEGAFAANWSDARIKWIEDCHGDSYGSFANNTAVYVAGHPHYCQNLGGFPETSPRTWHRAVSFSRAVTGTLTKDTQGYPSFTGQPAPSLLNWFPDMDTGTASGQSQGPWAVTGNNSYVVMVGEFKNVNQSPQQGLSRFAVKEIAPNRQGPRVSGSAFVPTLSSPGAGQVRVQWQANWDRDNSNLTYTVLRNGSPAYSVSQLSTFWQRPTLVFNDSGLAGGQQNYRIRVQDPFGNTVTGDTASITITGTTNEPPVASFTASTSLLTVSVNASASSDPDGTISSYTWGWGDGGTSTGVTSQHTYAVAGTYTISLTVRDNDGASSSTSRQVTVSATANQPPSAAFTVSANQLSVTTDASASSDPDGTINSYSWTFGDGGTDTGVNGQHSYAANGTYTITLTVTDNDGATDTASQTVTVASDPGAPLASDAFGRTLGSGWGTADSGGAWSVGGTTSFYSVSGGDGRMNLAASRGTSAYLGSVFSNASDTTVTLSLDKIGNGGGTFMGVIGRKAGTSEYRGKVKVDATGAVTVQLTRLSGNTETTLGQFVTGLGITAGQQLQLRVQVTGTSPTTLRAKAWRTGTAEPGTWQLSTTDNTVAALQAAGNVGLLAYLSGSATNAPVNVLFDDFTVRQAG